MRLKSNQSLLRSTESGQVGWTIGLWYLLFFSILLMTGLQIELYRASSGYLEDALASSNLAAAVIDVEEYGKTHNVLIGNAYQARERFEKALKINLGLNDDGECAPGSVTAPNGVKVEATGIYSEISYEIKGFLGLTVQAHKGKLVDVCANESQREEDG